MVTGSGRRSVVFRTDASLEIGSGHVKRCLALADSLSKHGWDCAFATSEETLAVVPSLGDRNHGVVTISAEAGCKNVQSMLDRWPEGVAWLVVDHYQLDRSFETACRSWADRIMVIDDLADRAHDCDLLIDQTEGRTPGEYAPLVESTQCLRLGAQYALLRPEFRKYRQLALSRRNGIVERILVALGGTDPDNLTATVLDGLEALADRAITIDVVLGHAAPGMGAVAARIRRSPLTIDLHVETERMAELMAYADLAIGAGGVSSWERCTLGLPSLVIMTADNQFGNTRSLFDAGAAIIVNGEREAVTSDSVAEATIRVLEAPAALCDMARCSAELCDGKGVERVVHSMGSL